MHSARRLLLRGAVSAATLSVAAAAGLLRAGTSRAWGLPSPQVTPAAPPSATAGLLQALRGAQSVLSEHIHIHAADVAADGDNVYLECASTLPDVDGLVVFGDRNPQPLIAAYWFAPEVMPELKMRIRLYETSNIWVVVRSRGQFYKAHKQVTVTVGGCGVGRN